MGVEYDAWPLHMSGTEKGHKPFQKSYSELGFRSGLRPPLATSSGIRQRTQDGLVDARKRGVAFGRPRKLRRDQQELALKLIKQGKSVSAVAKTFNVHPATIYRCLETRQGN